MQRCGNSAANAIPPVREVSGLLVHQNTEASRAGCLEALVSHDFELVSKVLRRHIRH